MPTINHLVMLVNNEQELCLIRRKNLKPGAGGVCPKRKEQVQSGVRNFLLDQRLELPRYKFSTIPSSPSRQADNAVFFFQDL
jgi:hypothetical protein